MATTLDGPLRKVAKTLLDRFGTTVTVRIVTYGAYNTTTGTGTDTNSDTSTKGVLYDYRADEVYGLVQRGDRKLIVAALDVTTEPTAKARAVISSVVYEIVTVETLWSGDQATAYILQIRGPA